MIAKKRKSMNQFSHDIQSTKQDLAMSRLFDPLPGLAGAALIFLAGFIAGVAATCILHP